MHFSMTGDARAETMTVAERIELARLELETKKVELQTEQVGLEKKKVEADPRTKMIEAFESLCSKECTEINEVTMKIATNTVVVDIAKIAIASSIQASKDRMENAVAFLTELECNRLEEKKVDVLEKYIEGEQKLAEVFLTAHKEINESFATAYTNASKNRAVAQMSMPPITRFPRAPESTELVEEGGGKRRKISHSTTGPASGA